MVNPGRNYCYTNSLLQSLARISTLSPSLSSIVNPSAIEVALQHLVLSLDDEHVLHGDCTVVRNAMKITPSFLMRQFDNYTQECPIELLYALIPSCAALGTTFRFRLHERVSCNGCGSAVFDSSTNGYDESSYVLTLGISPTGNLQDCYGHNFKEEPSDRNCHDCLENPGTNSFKSSDSATTPVLCIQLVRYLYLLPKIMTRVNIPQFININGVPRRFVSAILHSGPRPTSGHYVCVIRVGDEIFLMDDVMITRVDSVRSACEISRSEVAVVFYQLFDGEVPAGNQVVILDDPDWIPDVPLAHVIDMDGEGERIVQVPTISASESTEYYHLLADFQSLPNWGPSTIPQRRNVF